MAVELDLDKVSIVGHAKKHGITKEGFAHIMGVGRISTNVREWTSPIETSVIGTDDKGVVRQVLYSQDYVTGEYVVFHGMKMTGKMLKEHLSKKNRGRRACAMADENGGAWINGVYYDEDYFIERSKLYEDGNYPGVAGETQLGPLGYMLDELAKEFGYDVEDKAASAEDEDLSDYMTFA